MNSTMFDETTGMSQKKKQFNSTIHLFNDIFIITSFVKTFFQFLDLRKNLFMKIVKKIILKLIIIEVVIGILVLNTLKTNLFDLKNWHYCFVMIFECRNVPEIKKKKKKYFSIIMY